MADHDLKEELNKVRKAEGTVFFWGYGTGKRKPPLKAGDGVLRVFKSKAQVKKPEFQEMCECAQFLHGTCWSEGGTIKVAGQGVGEGQVSKITLSAKSETGNSYDFVLATEEEATARENGTREVESEEVTTDMQGDSDPGAAYRTAVAKLSEDLKAALHLGGDAAQEIKQQFAQANAYAQQKDYKAALMQLVQLRRRIQDALNTGTKSSTPSGAPDLGLWTVARNTAIKQIRFVQAELLKTHDPECIQAAKKLEAVPTKLNAALDSRESAEALENYVADEELIALMDHEKFFGVTTDVRNSLLTTLQVVKNQFAS
jgi:hypothetical protein